MTPITDFLPQIQQVNVLCCKFLEQDEFDCKEYRTVVDFYYTHRDVGQFEKMVLDVLLEKEKDMMRVLLTSLRCELDKYIKVYDCNDGFFEEIEADAVEGNVETFDFEIEKLIGESNQYGVELFDVTAMIDYKAEMPEGFDQHNIWERYDAVLDKHRRVTASLFELYNMREQRKIESAKYDFNPFSDIYDLCEHFRAIIDKYLPIEMKSVAIAKSYFNMGLISTVRQLCNGEQFEDISEMELYAVLNNQPSETELKIKSGEKTRVCYLIHCLSEQLKGAEKSKWRSEILQKIGITENYYSSKYREPVSDIPSQKSELFAKKLKLVLG